MDRSGTGEATSDEGVVRLVTVREAAALLGVSEKTIYSWIERRPPVVPYIRLGSGRGVIRFDRAELRKHVHSRAVAATEIA